MYLSHERSRRGSHHRFITEKMVFANWARTLDIHFYQPDWKPPADITNMNSSYAPALAGSWVSCWSWALELWDICVDSFQWIPSLVNVNVWDSSSTEQAAVVAVSRLPKQLGRMGSLHNRNTKPQQWFGSVTIRMNFILKSKLWMLAWVCVFNQCRAALVRLHLSRGERDSTLL